jgi:DNA-binding phage protein
MSMSFKERIGALKKTQDYCLEEAKLEFVAGLTRLMARNGFTNTKLAEQLQTSNAYITKVLRGDTNFTIESMVKLTHALGGKLHIHVAESDANVRWLEHMSGMAASHHSKKLAKADRKIDISSILEKMKSEETQVCA